MQAIWQSREPEITIREVCDGLASQAAASGESPLAYSTVKTVMERLVEKGHLAARQRGKVGFFRALSSPEEATHSTVKDFVERTFGGMPSPLVSYLANGARLSAKDIARLEKLVSQAKGRSKTQREK
jgi:predicted transcriptional regulator